MREPQAEKSFTVDKLKRMITKRIKEQDEILEALYSKK
jgi:hypothetical protein